MVIITNKIFTSFQTLPWDRRVVYTVWWPQDPSKRAKIQLSVIGKGAGEIRVHQEAKWQQRLIKCLKQESTNHLPTVVWVIDLAELHNESSPNIAAIGKWPRKQLRWMNEWSYHTITHSVKPRQNSEDGKASLHRHVHPFPNTGSLSSCLSLHPPHWGQSCLWNAVSPRIQTSSCFCATQVLRMVFIFLRGQETIRIRIIFYGEKLWAHTT